MNAIFSPSLIFISHASTDKEFVEKAIQSIPKSHLFYDINTINPGAHTVEALDDGLRNASVFAMFVSPNTPKSCWVKYESGVAEVERIKRNHIKIVAIPINGATFKDAPDWMQRYMAVPTGYSHTDIARLLKYLYEEALYAQGMITPPLFIGREDICNKIIMDSRTRPAETGVPVNFIILSNVQGMGRLSVAKSIVSKVFPGARRDLPIFELPRHADAVELFVALRQDITGNKAKEWIQSQITNFPTSPEEQAEVILANIMHFSSINQTVVIRSAYALRDQSKDLKEWVLNLFALMRKEPNARVIWISERLLPPEAIRENENVLQYSIPELSDDQVIYLLSELLVNASPPALKKVTPYVHGHPASAHYVATLIRSAQRDPDSFFDKPQAVLLFQQKCINGATSEESIGILGRKIIKFLKHLPWADFPLIEGVFSDYTSKKVAECLWNMADNCVISYNMNNGYRLAELIRSTFVADEDEQDDKLRLEALARNLKNRLNDNELSLGAIEALLFVFVRQSGSLPDEFRSILTGGTLLDIVDQYYQLGHSLSKEWQDNFRIAAKLSLLAPEIPMSADTMENILFNGADALIRVGDDPSEIIERMRQKKLPSVNYLLGSYYYHQKEDLDTAISYLELALQSKSFTKRTGRLLAKAYLQKGMPKQSLEVFKKLGDARVNRDTGLLAQKVRCLRAVNQHAEANKLVLALSSVEDELGEFDILTAARLMKEGRHDDALEAVERAKGRPKVNRVNLRLLETAIKIEKGEFSGLEDTCKMAIAVGMKSGAHSLKARAFICSGKWQSAEQELACIANKNYYDKLLTFRMLELKKEDVEIVADPLLRKSVNEEFERLLVELKKSQGNEWIDYDN